ncbi:MAG: RNA polymerase Rpb6, partial [Bacteroidales bacterium]|nr:RNA polymerase Rpb6 [Bacteroidales bacterium]
PQPPRGFNDTRNGGNKLEEISENRDQNYITPYNEKLPKPTLIPTQKFKDGKLYFRNTAKEKDGLDF